MEPRHPEECIQAVPAGIVEQIEAQIQRRLGGQVSNLGVVMRGDGLALQGRSRTHSARQLAQPVAMETTKLPILADEIRV